MDIEFPSMTPAPEKKSAKKRKLYLLRLNEQGLRSERLVRKTAKPDQFQIAQLSAAIGNRSGQKKLPFELASQAMRLWDAAGRALWVEEQTDLVCRGLLYYDRQDWWTHARDLVKAYYDSENDQPGHHVDTDEDEFLVAGCKAGDAIEMLWDKTHLGFDPQFILKALFPGKGETDRTRWESFFGLVKYINKFLEADDKKHGAIYRKVKSDTLTMRIENFWHPLGFSDEETRRLVLKVTRERLATRLKPRDRIRKPCARSLTPCRPGRA